MPVIEAYRLNGRLRQVDASLSAEEVYQKVRELALPYTKWKKKREERKKFYCVLLLLLDVMNVFVWGKELKKI